MASARCPYTLHMMGMKIMVRVPRHGRVAAGIALLTVLTVAGAYVEANPVHRYGGLHLTSHPPLAAYLLLAVPALALIWRDRRPVEVLGLAVAGVVGWVALGQIDKAAPAHLRTGMLTRCANRPSKELAGRCQPYSGSPTAPAFRPEYAGRQP